MTSTSAPRARNMRSISATVGRVPARDRSRIPARSGGIWSRLRTQSPSIHPASGHSELMRPPGAGGCMSLPGAHGCRGRAAPRQSTCCSQQVNSGMATRSRIASMGVSSGTAVRSTSTSGRIASRSAATPSSSHPSTTMSRAPPRTAATASSTSRASTDTRTSQAGSAAISTASARRAGVVRRNAAPDRTTPSSTSARVPSWRTVMRMPSTPSAASAMASSHEVTKAAHARSGAPDDTGRMRAATAVPTDASSQSARSRAVPPSARSSPRRRRLTRSIRQPPPAPGCGGSRRHRPVPSRTASLPGPPSRGRARTRGTR